MNILDKIFTYIFHVVGFNRVKAVMVLRRVLRVIDGDTSDTIDLKQIVTRVRKADINTPERGEPYYKEAKEKLKTLIEGKNIWLFTVKGNDKDQYGRTVAYVFRGFVNINLVMVWLGLAEVVDPEYRDPFFHKQLLFAQSVARFFRRGIWSTNRVKSKVVRLT